MSVQPWLLAAVAGLLLHALSHDVLAAPSTSVKARVGDTLAGWAGLALAVVGVEPGGWVESVPMPLRLAGIALLAAAIAARSFMSRARPHAHGHAHHHGPDAAGDEAHQHGESEHP
ncbi:Hypothetical protein A7982_10068 [Minicystis rosea]|nr:Hypothetical protein A7982_10068 [Minicystis rosea]